MTRPALRALEQAYGRAVGALTMLDLLRGQALSEAMRPSGERLHLARGMVADVVSQLDDAMLELTREKIHERRP
jgi:hypothetical protein